MKAVDSILNQTVESDLFIYRDGEVTQELDDYLGQLSLNPQISIYCSDVNKGLAKGLNVLINEALEQDYDYIARMDSDDISRLDRFEKQIKLFESNPEVDVCGGFCSEFGSSFAIERKTLPLTHDELYKYSITRCPFVHPTVMFRTKVFSRGIRYPTNTHFSEDMALWFLFLDKGFKFANVNDVILDYYLDERTIERRKGFLKFISEFRLRSKYMFSLNEVSLYNIIHICSRFILHMSPPFLVKALYKSRQFG
ncbi:glycosyltransferase [Vibrio sp. 1567]|uniref:glycosyltransferase n=1 Tax=Vibrio sp. 1567 TaxID=3074564 RepID=UPI002964E221|nr:glycosyltransferase [Vibrio sp. 1567]MDW2169809.1 glycosyltransferase [Vibrio sp. 1567]